MRVKIVTKHSVIFMLLLSKTRGWRQKNFLYSMHTICLHCYYERSKCSPLDLTHAVRWWRHCCTAHTCWHGLQSPHQ